MSARSAAIQTKLESTPRNHCDTKKAIIFSNDHIPYNILQTNKANNEYFWKTSKRNCIC